MKTFWNMFLAFFYNRFRDFGSLFWNLAFPLMFMFIFGLAFGTGSTGDSTTASSTEWNWTHVGVYFSEGFSEDFKDRLADLVEDYGLKLFETPSEGELETGVIRGSSGVRYGIAFTGDPKAMGLTAYLSAGNQNNEMYQSTVNSLAQDLRTKEANFREILNVEVIEAEIYEKPVTTVGYILSGILSISITFSGLSALIISLGHFRKRKIIRRFLATPLKGSTFLYADILNNYIFSFISLCILFLVSAGAFRIRFTIHLPYLALTFVSSLLFMMALGGFFLVLLRSPKAAMNVSNLFSNVLIFFSGVYFPLEVLPEWLRSLAFYLPMTYVARSMRFSLGQDFIPLSEFYTSNLIFLAIGLITIPLFGYFIFKREQE